MTRFRNRIAYEDYLDSATVSWRSSLSDELLRTSSFYEQNDLSSFRGHRDTLALLHLPRPLLPFSVFSILATLIDHSTFRALRLTCRHWHQAITAARPLRIRVIAKLPPEVLQTIFAILDTASFEAARHCCRAWMIASLHQPLLLHHLQAHAWLRCWQQDGGDIWRLSKRLSTETALLHGSLSLVSSLQLPPSMRLFFSVCGHLLLLAADHLSVYGQGLYYDTPLDTAALDVSMDSSRGRLAVAVLMTQRTGMVIDLAGERTVALLSRPASKVAICPVRNCLAFGSTQGVELHWCDVFNQSHCRRWIPFAMVCDELAFFSQHDHLMLIRTRGLAVHPTRRGQVRQLYHCLREEEGTGCPLFNQIRQDEGLGLSDHKLGFEDTARGRVDHTRQDKEKRRRSEYYMRRDEGTRRQLECETLRGENPLRRPAYYTQREQDGKRRGTRILSDGTHIIYAQQQKLCVGLLAEDHYSYILDGPGHPQDYSVAHELRWGVRIAVIYAQGIWFYSIPPDIFFGPRLQQAMLVTGRCFATYPRFSKAHISAENGNVKISACTDSHLLTWCLFVPQPEQASFPSSLEAPEQQSVALEADRDSDGDVIMRGTTPPPKMDDEGYHSGDDTPFDHVSLRLPMMPLEDGINEDDWMAAYVSSHGTELEDEGLGADVLVQASVTVEILSIG